MKHVALIGLLALAACGQERYIVTSGASESERWSNMMDCRTKTSAERGSYFKAGIMLGAGVVGGAVGGALAGGLTADTSQERYSDAVDRCMAARGYVASHPL